MYHFWFSKKMSLLHEHTGDENNKCKISIEGEVVELEYTHCHTSYIEAGGCSWGDEMYLGEGTISSLGRKPSLDHLMSYEDGLPPDWFDKAERLLDFAKRLKERTDL